MSIGFLKCSILFIFFLTFACPPKQMVVPHETSILADKVPISDSDYAEGIVHCKAVFDNMLKTTGSASSTADCLVGYKLPDFSATTLAGTEVTNQSLKGKLTIINFWFTACRPCVAEIPGFNDIVEKYGSDKLNYISIGRDPKEKVEVFLRKQPWQFDHIVDAESLIKGEFMFMWGFPTTLLVDESGKIIHAINRGKSGPGAVEHLKRRIIPHIDRALAATN